MEDKTAIRLPLCDTVTTNQFWETAQRSGYMEPEKYLMLAVLRDALLEYQNNLVLQNRRFKCARVWFFDERNNRLFSFESICEVLNVNASYIRKELIGLATQSSPVRRQAA